MCTHTKKTLFGFGFWFVLQSGPQPLPLPLPLPPFPKPRATIRPQVLSGAESVCLDAAGGGLSFTLTLGGAPT